MKRHIVSCVAAIVLTLGFYGESFSVWQTADYSVSAKAVKSGTIDNFSWELDDLGTLTISGMGQMKNFESQESPFTKNADIQSVVIEKGVTTIGTYLFYGCENLTSVTIPDSVVYIGSYAFYGCTALTSVSIPDSVSTIRNYAFYGCAGLTAITIPKSVSEIGNSSFSNCGNLEEISVSEQNYSFASVDGVVFSKDYSHLIVYPAGKKSMEYVVPDGVTDIGDYAFYRCNILSAVIIPKCVENIGERAFQECTNLTTVTLSNGLKSVGNYAFYKCTKLTAVTLPNSVDSIGEAAFYCCENLNAVTISEGLTSIGGRAFEDTSWIQAKRDENPFIVVNGILIDGRTCEGEVIIPNNVKTITSYAFNGADLTALTIPNSVTDIGNDAFRQCTDLTSVTLPDSITSIPNSMFIGCSALSEITIPDSVTRIEDGAFEFCENLTTVQMPNSLEYIGDAAFAYCDSLTEATIPEGVNYIGRWAFSYCDNFASVTVPASATKIGKPAFVPSADNLTITGYEGTEAKHHASVYGIKFISLGLFKGDLDGDGTVTDVDATAVLKEYATTELLNKDTTLSKLQTKSADVDGNGKIDMMDATLALRYYATTLLYGKALWGSILS